MQVVKTDGRDSRLGSAGYTLHDFGKVINIFLPQISYLKHLIYNNQIISVSITSKILVLYKMG